MQPTKPRLFIGSSKEALPIARAIHARLADVAEVTVWDQGIFELTSPTLSSLITTVQTSDFGVFVLSPDDVANIRGRSSLVPRDNVIFELGLFLGALGPKRTFYFVPNGVDTLHLPSDLLGLTGAQYESGRSDGRWRAAVDPGCEIVREHILGSGALQAKQSHIEETKNATLTQLDESGRRHSENRAAGSEITVQTHSNELLCCGDTLSYREIFKNLNGRWRKELTGYTISSYLLPEIFHLLPGVKLVGIPLPIEFEPRAEMAVFAEAKLEFSRSGQFSQSSLALAKFQKIDLSRVLSAMLAKGWISKLNNRGDFKITARGLAIVVV